MLLPNNSLSYRKSVSAVKLDLNDMERVPTLNEREMLRILDAKSEDLGLGRIIKDDCTPERYAALLN